MAFTINESLVVPDYPIWRISVEQYHIMIDSGALTEDDPVELLEGWLVTKMPKNRPHSLSTRITRETLARMIPSGWYVDSQEPITTTDSEPEPDIIVVRGSPRDYSEHPTAKDIALVVEVADATLQRDRTLKLRVYAGAGIAVYWILNLPERQLEVYSEPEGATYRQRRDYAEAEAVPVMIGDQEVGRVTVGELLA